VSIRRKLFLAFVAAAALPLCAVGVLARLYLQRAHADVEERFEESARLAVHAMRSDASTHLDQLRMAVRGIGDEALTLPLADEPAELKFLPRDWIHDAAGEKQLAEIVKNNHLSKKSVERIRAETLAKVKVVERDELATAAAVHQFREQHPEVLGVKIVLAGETLYTDLKQDFDYPGPVSAETVDTDARLPFLVTALDGRRFIVEVIEEDLTRFLVEIDPAGMTRPQSFMDSGRVFYLQTDGTPRHIGITARQLKNDVPLRAVAVMLPPAGERHHMLIRDEDWLLYHLPGVERDKWGFGGDAELVAAAPASTVYAPIVRFTAEVWAAALVSILVAVWLAYFLSGRFTESVENLKRGVDALSRGEFEKLQKSSGDELGGELVDSMNRMASVLTERTRKEEVENWRRLVRVLSHEINNTLGPVKSVATTVRDQISKQLPEGETAEDLRAAFRLIVDRTDSLSSFISGYAQLAKLPAPDRAPADLNEVVRGAASMLNDSAISRGIKISVHGQPTVGTPAIDRQQIERVIINLVKNAVEAARSQVLVRAERRGDMVELAVEDDGPGISPEARASLFVPYFSTKPGGSGIGLALARQIVLAHGGSIGSEDRPGGGTLFRVVLPVGALI
jgi:signal transduction histidine kinase